MSHIIKLLIERKVSVLEVIQWLLAEDESLFVGPAALQDAAQHRREFVPLFLNYLRIQANRHVLPSAPVRASNQAPSCSWQGRGSFPIRAVKYVSPQKAVHSFGLRAPRAGAKLDFGSTPARTRCFQPGWQERCNDGAASASLTEDFPSERSVPSFKFQRGPSCSTANAEVTGPERSFISSPSEHFHATPGRGRLCSSTPKNSSSWAGHTGVLRHASSTGTSRSPAAWGTPARGELSGEHYQSRGEGPWKKYNNTPNNTKGHQRYSEQKNTLKDYMVASTGKKASRKKAASFNSCGSLFAGEPKNNSWTGRSARGKLDLSDSSSFPTLGQSSAATQLSASLEPKTEKNKKKRIKPTRLKCSTENVGNSKKDKVPSFDQVHAMSTQLEEKALSVETKLTNSCGLQEERKMLKQLKAEMSGNNKFPIAIAQNCKPKSEASISKKFSELKQSTPSNMNNKISAVVPVTSTESNHINCNESIHNIKPPENGVRSSRHQSRRDDDSRCSVDEVKDGGRQSTGMVCPVDAGRDVDTIPETCKKCDCSPSQVTYQAALDICGALYAQLLLCNLTASLASELHFILQLLTIKDCMDTSQTREQEDLLGLPDLLYSTHNCVYFASSVLLGLNSLLLLFDRSLVRLLAENKRLQLFTPALQKELQSHAHSRSSKPSPKQPPRSPMKSVPFQREVDNRSNFPDNSTFHVFKKQRDLFYELLREWEREHESPDWAFSYCLGGAVRSLMQLGPDPCNMAHLARLFVAQLLCACEAGHTAPTLDDDDDVLALLKRQHPEKFERLQERLVAPSCASSTAVPAPSFPGVQQFFRDFIIEAASPAFCAHLEDQLVAKLSDLLGSSEGEQRVASAPASSLRLRQAGVLGKFVGVLWFAPYSSSLVLPQLALAHQVALRSKVQLRLPLCAVLRNCAVHGCLVAGVLSCVQLLSVADAVALHTCHLQTAVFALMYIYKLALGTCVYAGLPAGTDRAKGPSLDCAACIEDHAGVVSVPPRFGHRTRQEHFTDKNQVTNFSSDDAAYGDEHFITHPDLVQNVYSERKNVDVAAQNGSNATVSEKVSSSPLKFEMKPLPPAFARHPELQSPVRQERDYLNVASRKHKLLEPWSGTCTLIKSCVKPDATSASSGCVEPDSLGCKVWKGGSEDAIPHVQESPQPASTELCSRSCASRKTEESESRRRECSRRFTLWKIESSIEEENDVSFLKFPLESPNRASPPRPAERLGTCSQGQSHPDQFDRSTLKVKKTVFSPEVSLFLRLLLGWLFDQPVFPEGLFYTDPYSTNIDVQEYKRTVTALNDHYCAGCGHFCQHLLASSTAAAGTTPSGRSGVENSDLRSEAKASRVPPSQRGLFHTPPRQTANFSPPVKCHHESRPASHQDAILPPATDSIERVPLTCLRTRGGVSLSDQVESETALQLACPTSIKTEASEVEGGSKVEGKGMCVVSRSSRTEELEHVKNDDAGSCELGLVHPWEHAAALNPCEDSSAAQLPCLDHSNAPACDRADHSSAPACDRADHSSAPACDRADHSSIGELGSPRHSRTHVHDCSNDHSISLNEGTAGLTMGVSLSSSVSSPCDPSCSCTHVSCSGEPRGPAHRDEAPLLQDAVPEGGASRPLSAKCWVTPLKSTRGGRGGSMIASPEVRMTLQDTPQREYVGVEGRPPSPPPHPYRFDEHIVVDSQLLKEWCPQLPLLQGLLRQASEGPDRGGGARKIAPLSALPSRPRQAPPDQLGGPVEGLAKPPAQHSLQHQLEESFFHQQPSSVRQCVAFMSDSLATNCLRHLRTSLLPEATAQASRTLQDHLEAAFGLDRDDGAAEASVEFTSAEQVERVARQQLQLTVSVLRSQLTEACLQHLHSLLQEQQKLLRLLLPSDTSDKAVEVCARVIQRCCCERVTAWLHNDLVPSTPPSTFSPLTRALLRRVTTKFHLDVTANWSLTAALEAAAAHTPTPPAAGGPPPSAGGSGALPPSAGGSGALPPSAGAAVPPWEAPPAASQTSSCAPTTASPASVVGTPFTSETPVAASILPNGSPTTSSTCSLDGTSIISSIPCNRAHVTRSTFSNEIPMTSSIFTCAVSVCTPVTSVGSSKCASTLSISTYATKSTSGTSMSPSATSACTSAAPICTSATSICTSATSICTSATSICTSATSICTSATSICTSVISLCTPVTSIFKPATSIYTSVSSISTSGAAVSTSTAPKLSSSSREPASDPQMDPSASLRHGPTSQIQPPSDDHTLTLASTQIHDNCASTPVTRGLHSSPFHDPSAAGEATGSGPGSGLRVSSEEACGPHEDLHRQRPGPCGCDRDASDADIMPTISLELVQRGCGITDGRSGGPGGRSAGARNNAKDGDCGTSTAVAGAACVGAPMSSGASGTARSTSAAAVAGTAAAGSTTAGNSTAAAASTTAAAAAKDTVGTHDIRAPVPSLLKAEMKALVKTLLNSITVPGVPEFRSYLRPPYGPPYGGPPSPSGASPSQVKSGLVDGVFRERPRASPALPVSEEQLRALAVAVRDCVCRRSDLTSPLLRGLKALSVDIITTVCAAYPQLATSSVLSDYTALWGSGGPLECPPSLPTTILAPRVLRLVELRGSRGGCEGMRRLLQVCVQQQLLESQLLQDTALALLQHCWTQDVLHGLSSLVEDLCGPQEEESVMSFLPWLCHEMENFSE